jgi:hypothetical protein
MFIVLVHVLVLVLFDKITYILYILFLSLIIESNVLYIRKTLLIIADFNDESATNPGLDFTS